MTTYPPIIYIPENNPAITPDIILPSQFADMVGRSTELSPEQRLWRAVLEDAIYCWTRYIGFARVDPKSSHTLCRHAKLWAKADFWIFARAPSAYFSFNEACGALDINPESLRTALIRWKEGGQPLPSTRRAPSPRSQRQSYTDDIRAEIVRSVEQYQGQGYTPQGAARMVSQERGIPFCSVKTMCWNAQRARLGLKPLRTGHHSQNGFVGIKMAKGPHRHVNSNA